MKAQRGSRCIDHPSFNLSIRWWVGGQRHAPAALYLGKTWYPLCRRLHGPQGQSEWVWKVSPPLGFDSWTIQSVASCYTELNMYCGHLLIILRSIQGVLHI